MVNPQPKTAKVITLLQAALEYASQNLEVFPIKAGEKAPPLTMNGLKDATIDPEQINKWWGMWPNSNIGIRCSGLLVPDFDGQLGAESKAQLEAKFGKLPPTWTIRTGGGTKASPKKQGLHYVYRVPKDLNIRPGAGKYGYPGFDIRANDSYIVAVPSVTRLPYETIDNSPIANAPRWLLDIAKAGQNGTKPKPMITVDAPIPDGQRNATLTRIGGATRRQGGSQEAIEKALFACICETPLPEAEIKAIAASLCRYEPQPDTRPQPFNWHDFAIEHDALLAKELEPLDFLVANLIATPGIIILAAPKKRAKSWMALQLSQNIAAGVPFLGMATRQGRVIHFALEDGERRLKQRLNMQNAEPGLPITYCTKLEPLNSRIGIQALRELIKDERPVMVVIDTLAAAKDRRVDENSAGDTADLFNQLHEIALTENIVILIVAHHGKAITGDVGFDIRGSSAIPGATDVIIGLYKNTDGTFDFKAEGRDIGEVDLRVSFDADVTWCWHNEGDAKDVRRAEAENNIIEAIETLGGIADATIIATELDITRGTVQLHLKRMRTDGQLDYKLEQAGRVKKILYSLVPTISSSSSSHNHKHH